ncbi:helix-turn-helix domain-containing protein [Streptomyces coelicoflavus]|uniref:helix-turn-helix domain-containing protein n=1 Tax=Streptomyces coelicoflavus TaxID=285562 RepID=UPI000D591F3A|nr:helix-turn-helix domain-containing protein [Streptomyces coelicoflavus]
MEHTEKGAVGPIDTIRARTKQLRGHRGWTAAELGARLKPYGLRWDRSIVANFEAGRRRTVSVNELLALALVFDVAPVNLLVPVNDAPYQVAANRVEDADTVRAWVRGQKPLPGVDERTFFGEVSIADMRVSRQNGRGVTGAVIGGIEHVRGEGDDHGQHREAPER